MIKGIYSLITAVIVTSWGYFGEPGHVFGRHHSPEEREKAIEKSTWTCQDCNKINGVDKTRCRDCNTMRGFATEEEDEQEQEQE